jgi:hypothetical protein
MRRHCLFLFHFLQGTIFIRQIKEILIFNSKQIVVTDGQGGMSRTISGEDVERKDDIYK